MDRAFEMEPACPPGHPKGMVVHIFRDESPCELASLLIYRLMIELYAGMGSPKEAVRWGIKFEGLLRAVQKKPDCYEGRDIL